MKKISLIAAAILAAVSLFGLTTCEHIDSSEAGFAYNVTSGKEVNAENNPPLAQGFNPVFGINARLFVVNVTTHEYHFTGHRSGSSKYDEALEWNSSEGIDMSAEYSIFGNVSDLWQFYLHYGHGEHEYDTGSMDPRIYEALRQAGKVVDVRVNEITASMLAENIRVHPEKIREDVLAHVQAYMKQFGFSVTDLQFSSNFEYPNGDTIQDVRQQMTQIEASIRQAELELENTQTQNKINLAEAKQEGKKIVQEATRRAADMNAQTDALAGAIKASVDQVGIDGAVRLKAAELFSDLAKAGKIGRVILTEKSIFGEPFYPVVPPEPAKP